MIDSSTEAAATKPLERILDRLTGVEAKYDGYIARCPAHDDQNPSLSITEGDDGKVLLKCFAGCTFREIMEKLGLPQTAAFPDEGGEGMSTPSNKREYMDTLDTKGCTLQQYGEYKGLPIEFLHSVKVSEIPNYNGAPAVRMAYLDAHGEERCVRFRVSLKGDPRIKTRKGDKLRLYGIWKLDEARKQGYALIVEGESDAQTGWSHKYPVIGVPGANSWRDEWVEDLDGIERLYVVVEDEAGEALWAKLAASPLSNRLYRVTLEGAKDLSELHLQDQQRFSERLDEALLKAPSYVELAAAHTDQIAREAWEKCQDLAREERILDCFEMDLRACGVVGNATNCKLIYLALTTRLVDGEVLVNILVKGPSSAGKSHQVEKVLDFFPENTYHRLTASSERALIYDDTPVAHKFLTIAEADGIKGDTLTYIVRSLLSEGQIDYKTVVKDGEGLRPLHIHRDGPTGLITTTTRLRIHAENETRMLSIQADDSPELTSAIFEALAEEDFEPPDLEEWRALQTWLAYGETRVAIPYAKALAMRVPPVAVRMRRGFGQVLNLVRAHALLHRATRERDAKGRIIATLEDYRAVRGLVVKPLSEGVERAVPKIVRETVGVVKELLKEPGKQTVTVKEVSRKLGLDYYPTYRRVSQALDGGYLQNLEERPRQPARLVEGDPLPEDQQILPEPHELEGISTVSTFVRGDKDSPSPL